MLESDAVLSSDGVFRYWLERIWDRDGELLPWVMLNPSTADHTEDDPTIRRLTGFSQAWGYGGFVVVNLYALRTPHPLDLATAPDPVGPDNEEWIMQAAEVADGGDVMVAWGSNHAVPARRSLTVEVLMAVTRVPSLKALAINKDGNPSHPLYMAADREPIPWEDPHA